MSNQKVVVRVKHVSKVYKLYAKPFDRVKEAFSLTKQNYHKKFYALDDVSLELKRGEALGIIGRNGNGKSTLLKMITGVTNASINQKLTDAQSGFRAYSKRVLAEISPSDMGMGISTEILIKASSKGLEISEVPITILYPGNTSTHNPVSHGTSVLISTIKFTSIEHPLKFYGIPSVILLIIGATFSYFAVQYYVEIGRLNTNLTLVSTAVVLIGIVLLITAILLYSLVSVVRENNSK